MNNAIRINQFNSKYDNLVKSMGEVTWNELCELLSAHQSNTSKDRVPMFNLVRYRDNFDPSIADENTGHLEGESEVVPLRRTINIVQVDALVLDYDGEMTIEEAKQRFNEYEYFAYTSYNHLRDTGVEKFRLILPLSAPIPVRRINTLPIYEDFADEILKFAGPCDPVVLKPNQLYYIPATHPKRLDLATTWRNAGKILDWNEWQVNANTVNNNTVNVSASARTGVVTGNQHQKLDPDTMFHTYQGMVKARDVDKTYQKVVCPFHDDKAGSELLKRFDDSGVVFFLCKHCGGFVLSPDHQTNPTPAENLSSESENEDPVQIYAEWPYDYTDPSTFRPQIDEQRRKTNKTLSSIGSWIRFSREFSTAHIVYLPEGSGKSQLALDLVRMGECVIFACQTWDQVFEKQKDFSKLLANNDPDKHYNVEMALSLDALVRLRWKIKLVRADKQSHFKTGQVDIEQSFERIRKSNPGITPKFFKSWWKTVGDSSGKLSSAMRKALEETTVITHVENNEEVGVIFHEKNLQNKTSGLVITTFSQLRLFKVKGDTIPKDWLIWYDDPGLTDVANISPLENADIQEVDEPLSTAELGEIDSDDEEQTSTLRERTDIRTINGTKYSTRPIDLWLGYSTLRNRMVFTTTELLTKRMLFKHLSNMDKFPEVHDEMMAMPFGRITIMGTEKVRRKFDAIVPIIARYLCKDGKEVKLIADGMGTHLNHVNSKGSNVLGDTDILVEISIPHPSEIRTICDMLDVDFNRARDSITHDLMLDKIHQAIGRNSGFRWNGHECIVLVDKLHHARIIKNVRYAFDRHNSVIIDKTSRSKRVDKMITESASPLTTEIEKYLNRFDDYICDGRSITHAIDHVVKEVEDGVKRISYIARLLTALTSLSKVRLDSEADTTMVESHTVKKYRSVWKHIHDKWITESIRDKVMQQYLLNLNNNVDKKKTSKARLVETLVEV